MKQSIEISEKLLKELEKMKTFPDDSIENVIWNLIKQTSSNIKKDLPTSHTTKNVQRIFRNKSLKEIFG